MSATMAVAIAAHTLVERRGARPGSLHAALPIEGGGWATACGEALQDSERGVMHALDLGEALAFVAMASTRLCARCDRVGAVL